MATNKDLLHEMQEKLEEIESKTNRIIGFISKLSHYSGNDSVLAEFGFDRWVPGKEDMKKYKG